MGLFGVLSIGCTRNASADLLSLYMEGSGVQSTYVSGATTETFNSATAGTYSSTYTGAIGTYAFSSSDKGVIQAADQYGGASNSQYLAFGSQSGTSGPITITLSGSENYFGIWVSAADANNGISFYNGSTLLAHITTATITSLLTSTSTLTAINGTTTYSSSSYYGNPNNLSEDTTEPFVYLDIIDSTGTFNKIVLDNSGTTGTGFESDNHSIYDGVIPISPNATSVYVETVPEPSQYAMMVGALLFCLVFGHRLFRQQSWAAL